MKTLLTWIVFLIALPLGASTPSERQIRIDFRKWAGWGFRGFDEAPDGRVAMALQTPLGRMVQIPVDELPAVHERMRKEGVPFVDLYQRIVWPSECNSPFPVRPQSGPRQLIVITDLNPDDRIALQVLAEVAAPEDVLLVGTSSLNSERKATLARQLLDQLNFKQVPVAQGSGSAPPDHEQVASTRTAARHTDEGSGILPLYPEPPIELMLGEDSLIHKIGECLRRNEQLGYRRNIDIVVLTTPADLLMSLFSNIESLESIGSVHLMGGWIEIGGKRRTTYNWSLDPDVTRSYLRFAQVFPFQTVIYSSHLIKPTFAGGSLNEGNARNIMEALNKAASVVPSLQDFLVEAEKWDEHILQEYPALRETIGPYKGRQFTPADPLVMAAATTPGLITRFKPVKLQLSVDDEIEKGYLIDVQEVPSSQILLVEKVDVRVFEDVLVRTFRNSVFRSRELHKRGRVEMFPACRDLWLPKRTT